MADSATIAKRPRKLSVTAAPKDKPKDAKEAKDKDKDKESDKPKVKKSLHDASDGNTQAPEATSPNGKDKDKKRKSVKPKKDGKEGSKKPKSSKTEKATTGAQSAAAAPAPATPSTSDALAQSPTEHLDAALKSVSMPPNNRVIALSKARSLVPGHRDLRGGSLRTGKAVPVGGVRDLTIFDDVLFSPFFCFVGIAVTQGQSLWHLRCCRH